jgi:hypothetical protein
MPDDNSLQSESPSLKLPAWHVNQLIVAEDPRKVPAVGYDGKTASRKTQTALGVVHDLRLMKQVLENTAVRIRQVLDGWQETFNTLSPASDKALLELNTSPGYSQKVAILDSTILITADTFDDIWDELR